MGFNQVYQQLKELFPTIDARLVKAVAIENSDDVAAAVSMIIDEVIPSLSVSPSQIPASPSKPLPATPQMSISHSSPKPLPATPQMSISNASPKPLPPKDVYSTYCQELQSSAKTIYGAVGHVDEGFRLKKQTETCSSSSTVPVSSLTNLGNNDSHLYGTGNIYPRTQIEKALNDQLILESSSPFTRPGSNPSAMPVLSPIILGRSNNHPYLKAQIEEAQALNDLESSCSFTSHSSESDAVSSLGVAEDVDEDSGIMFCKVSSSLNQENNVNDQVCMTFDNSGLVLHKTEEISEKPLHAHSLAPIVSLEGRCGPVNINVQRGEMEATIVNNDPDTINASLDKISDNLVRHHNLTATSSQEGQCSPVISTGRTVESGDAIFLKNDYMDTDEERVPVASVGLQSKIDPSADLSEESDASLDSDIHQTESVLEASDVDDDSVLNTLVTHSGQICRVDLLEDMIKDARNNKKILFASMDSVIKIMKEVEEKEKAAEIAKAEAAKGGADILSELEDLKKRVQHEKGKNDKDAGEVHGEKAILATEARELQSGFLSLSDERDKSLSILDEMRETLEARLAAAEDEIRKAETEKAAKEESARSALAEQEAIMAKVAQEAKILEALAEENSRLREFLTESGHTLDTLSGEISVICHDVRLLKEKFDERLPLSESVSSSQTSVKLASSGSSRRSLESIEASMESVEGYESQKETSPAHSLHVESPLETSQEEKKSSNGSRELVDDGWELFENDA